MSPVSPELALALAPALAAVGLVMRISKPRRPDEGGVDGALAAERRVVECLEPLEREDWRVFHDLHLPRADGRGTTHFDHVVVGENGVFVIETRPANGPVLGCRYDRWWTELVDGRERRMPNPMFEAKRRVEALALWLRMPERCFHSAVFLVGRPERQKETPDSVVSERHADWIRSRPAGLLMPVEAMRVADELDDLRRKKLTLLHALRLRGAEEAADAGDYRSFGVVRGSGGELAGS